MLCSFSSGGIPDSCSRCLREQGGRLNPVRTDRSASRIAWPRFARPARRAPSSPDPPVVCPGFGFDKYNTISRNIYFLVQNPDIPQAGRIGAHGRVAGRGRAGLYANRTVAKASKTRRLNVAPEARTSEILFKPMGEQNPRLTTGSSPVYHRDEKRSFFLAADQCTDAYLSL